MVASENLVNASHKIIQISEIEKQLPPIDYFSSSAQCLSEWYERYMSVNLQ